MKSAFIRFFLLGMIGTILFSCSPGTLHEAARLNDLEAAKGLIEEGEPIDQRDRYGATPLIMAVYPGHAEMVEYLISQGADVNKGDEFGYTPLIEAAREGQVEVARILIEHGADINARSTTGGFTPIYMAAESGFTDFVKLMLDSGADPNGAYGNSPLCAAAKNGQMETAVMLLDSGADPNYCNILGTPLTFACEGGDLEMVKYLVSRGANPHKMHKDGYSSLTVAAKFGWAEIVRYLVEVHKMDPTAKDNAGNTAMMMAKKHGQTAVIDYLRSKGITD